MPRYQVPQFIEIEDKIFGPLTFRQFVYLIGGVAGSYLIYRFLPFLIAILLIIPLLAFAGALAFYRPNNKPFIHMVEAAIKYVTGHRLYIWKKEVDKKRVREKAVIKERPGVVVPKVSDSKLKDLAWSLDVNENLDDDNV